jgi:hypothetical protein
MWWKAGGDVAPGLLFPADSGPTMARVGPRRTILVIEDNADAGDTARELYE